MAKQKNVVFNVNLRNIRRVSMENSPYHSMQEVIGNYYAKISKQANIVKTQSFQSSQYVDGYHSFEDETYCYKFEAGWYIGWLTLTIEKKQEEQD